MSFLPVDIEQRLHEEIERMGLVLLELKRRGQQNTTVIEVIVDSHTGGVTLEELTGLTRTVSALLDEAEEAIPGRYRLEVSSAGLDRPINQGWQFRKNAGRLIKLTFDDDAGRRKTEVFRLIESDETSLTLGPKAKNAKPGVGILTLPIDRVKQAVIEPEF